MSCPKCSGQVRSFGWREIQPYVIEDGRLKRVVMNSPKLKCDGCNHIFVQRPMALEAMVRDQMVAIAKREGATEAARQLGCDEKKLMRTVRRWIEVRKGDVPSYRPSTMALQPIRVGGENRVMICDAGEAELYDITPSVEAAGNWISSHVGRVESVLLPVDAGLRAQVAKHLPGVTVMVAPRIAARAMKALAAKTLRQLSSTSRRNFRESPALLDIRDDKLSPAQADEVSSFWSGQAKALRRHLQALISGVGESAHAFRKALEPAMEFLAAWAPNSTLADLLRNWSVAFEAGAGNSWLDVVSNRIEGLVRSVFANMPRAGYDIVRAVLVFPEFARSAEGGLPLLALNSSVSPSSQTLPNR